MATKTLALAAIGLVLSASLLSACGPGPGPHPTPPPTPPPVPEQQGEIWQWAIGRNVWTDPALQSFTGDLGRVYGTTTVKVHSEGFQLTPDSSGVVTAVTLYNDENSLRVVAHTDSAFSAYQGELPGGLSWDMTAADVNATFGAANQVGGYGAGEIQFEYLTNDGDHLTITFDAIHQSDLPSAEMHSIAITR